MILAGWPGFCAGMVGVHFAMAQGMPGAKKCVYVLRSAGASPRYYTGLTSHVPSRLAQHNAGLCRHTASGRPWEVDVVIDFADEARARRFERYLKSGSGLAFAQRHLR
jgi:putative endonuclease